VGKGSGRNEICDRCIICDAVRIIRSDVYNNNNITPKMIKVKKSKSVSVYNIITLQTSSRADKCPNDIGLILIYAEYMVWCTRMH